MEGLPRIVFLSVEAKICAAPTDFGPKIREYIRRHYQENSDNYEKALEQLTDLRENSSKLVGDLSSCKLLKRYYSQLLMLKSRFPMEEGDEVSVPFLWMDKFSDMGNSTTIDDVNYEMACVMHNIGAMHSHLGSQENRSSAEGVKAACSHFQCAAWCFQYLRDHMHASAFCVDFDKSILSWYETLMLAQAQECILEKAMVDNRKNTINAKVAAQVCEFYNHCVYTLEHSSIMDIAGSTRCKASDDQLMGTRLAWFQHAQNKLAEATKLEQRGVKDTLQFANDVITAKVDNAKKENDFIYHDKVPSIDTLPEVKGVALVKGIEFNPLDPDVSGADFFAALVPLRVHQSNSLYSEEKAKLLRSISEKVSNKDEELQNFLNSLQLDQLSLNVDFSQAPLPEALLERSAAINADPDAMSRLLESLDRLTGCYKETDRKLSELDSSWSSLIKEIRDIDAKLPTPKRSLCKSLLEKVSDVESQLSHFRQAHQKATQSNVDLQNAAAAHTADLKMLSLPLAQLKTQLPAPSTQAAETAELKRILEKVEEMKNQRQMLMEQLRASLLSDDLTKIILSDKDADQQEVFGREMKKHDKQITLIDQNLTAQGNILEALTSANAKYAECRQKTVSATRERDKRILDLIKAFDVQLDVSEKAERGRAFYTSLLNSLRELEERLDGWREQWDQLKVRILNELKSETELSQTEKSMHASALHLHDQSALAHSTAPPSVAASQAARPKGARLGDYMEYYRSKKAGIAVPSPADMAVIGAAPTATPASSAMSSISGSAMVQYQPANVANAAMSGQLYTPVTFYQQQPQTPTASHPSLAAASQPQISPQQQAMAAPALAQPLQQQQSWQQPTAPSSLALNATSYVPQQAATSFNQQSPHNYSFVPTATNTATIKHSSAQFPAAQNGYNQPSSSITHQTYTAQQQKNTITMPYVKENGSQLSYSSGNVMPQQSTPSVYQTQTQQNQHQAPLQAPIAHVSQQSTAISALPQTTQQPYIQAVSTAHGYSQPQFYSQSQPAQNFPGGGDTTVTSGVNVQSIPGAQPQQYVYGSSGTATNRTYQPTATVQSPTYAQQQQYNYATQQNPQQPVSTAPASNQLGYNQSANGQMQPVHTAYNQFQQPTTAQTPRFQGIDEPIQVALPAPLMPSKPQPKQLTSTEKELADLFG